MAVSGIGLVECVHAARHIRSALSWKSSCRNARKDPHRERNLLRSVARLAALAALGPDNRRGHVVRELLSLDTGKRARHDERLQRREQLDNGHQDHAWRPVRLSRGAAEPWSRLIACGGLDATKDQASSSGQTLSGRFGAS
jgi:hypothetical protein